MSEESDTSDFYNILPSSYSSSTDKPITNLGDISAGLRTTLSGKTVKNGTICNVSVSLPKEIANTTSDKDYHFAIREHVVQDVQGIMNGYTTFDDYRDLERRFNRLLDYLENWIDTGNLNMSDLKQYVNQEE